ncbi:hypothetical protein GCM10010406_33940 [Streptomyces thermolineatus]|uniref:Hydrolase n=1 Tax=Streptomyces thermolineatus TaxID=44033 RepID=A0ABN3M5X6_9ACTN
MTPAAEVAYDPDRAPSAVAARRSHGTAPGRTGHTGERVGVDAGQHGALRHGTGGFRVVATDLDGTLLRSDTTVSPRTRHVLRRAAELGVHHVVVTGRSASGCRPILDALGYRGLAVCGQGAQVYDSGAHRLLSSATLDPAPARTLVERVAALTGPLDLAVATSGLDGEFVVTEGFPRGDEAALTPFRTVPGHRLWERPVDKVFLRHATLPDEELVAVASRLCDATVTVTHSGPRMVEVLPAGVDKAVGLARVVHGLGLRSSEVVAFGDMPNDIPMLDWAGHAVAMGNCHPGLKEVADEVARSNDEDGVAVVLARLLGIPLPAEDPAPGDPGPDEPAAVAPGAGLPGPRRAGAGHGGAGEPLYRTSPSRQSQTSPPDRSSGTAGAKTWTQPSSSAVRTTPSGVRAEVGPRHRCRPRDA